MRRFSGFSCTAWLNQQRFSRDHVRRNFEQEESAEIYNSIWTEREGIGERGCDWPARFKNAKMVVDTK